MKKRILSMLLAVFIVGAFMVPVSAEAIETPVNAEESVARLSAEAAADPDVKSASTVTVDREKVTLKRTATFMLNVKATDSDGSFLPSGTHADWTSSDESVVSVKSSSLTVNNYSASATVTAVKEGQASITATVNGMSASCEVTVVPIRSTSVMTQEEKKALTEEEKRKLDVYDGRDMKIMSGVNSQNTGNCVAQGYAACMETSMLMQGWPNEYSNLDLYVKDLVYRFYHHAGDPLHNTDDDKQNLNRESGIGVFPLAAFLTQWNGPILSSKATGKLGDVNGYENNAVKPEDIVFGFNSKDRETVKRYIVKYGAVGFAYNAGSGLYHYSRGIGNHFSAIVGWDDTVDTAYFPEKYGIKNNGAWIVKDSAGEYAHASGNGYFYLSYESTIAHPVVCKVMQPDKYQFNYF